VITDLNVEAAEQPFGVCLSLQLMDYHCKRRRFNSLGRSYLRARDGQAIISSRARRRPRGRSAAAHGKKRLDDGSVAEAFSLKSDGCREHCTVRTVVDSTSTIECARWFLRNRKHYHIQPRKHS
jgi:hypothetical protein